MRPRWFHAAGLSAAVVLLTCASAGATTGGPVPGGGSPDPVAGHPIAGSRICFASIPGKTVLGYTSQDFEQSFDAYDSEGADDVRLRRTCRVRSMHVSGTYFNGPGPAESLDIRFYKDAYGLPKDEPFEKRLRVEPVLDSKGSFDLNLWPPVTLHKKTPYWVSVQVNMDFVGPGQWGWTATELQTRDPAAWRNENGGFGFADCERWANMQNCLNAVGPDFVFSLSGKPYRP